MYAGIYGCNGGHAHKDELMVMVVAKEDKITVVNKFDALGYLLLVREEY